MIPSRRILLGTGSQVPALNLPFAYGTMPSGITVTRASSATYFDSTGTLQTASNNVGRIDYDPTTLQCLGLLVEGASMNYLLNSGTPATQTTASLGVGTYTLWVVGSGDATSSPNTASGSGFGVATAGAPNTFSVFGTGTVDITVSGSLTRFQLEPLAYPTSYIATTGTTASRAADVVTYSYVFTSGGSIVYQATIFSTGLNFQHYSIDNGGASLQVSLSNLNGYIFNSSFQFQSNITFSQGKSAFNFSPTQGAHAVNGLASVKGTVASFPATLNRLVLGASSTLTGQMYGHIQSFAYYKPPGIPLSQLSQASR